MPGMTIPERFLFICGTARSGTTALTRIINSHPQIGIGMERFKNITTGRTKHLLVPELFAEDRFFDFADGLTNFVPGKSEAMSWYYDELRAKFPNLTYIGDKVPNSFRVVDHVHKKFAATKHIFIVRDIFETACSWQARAQNSRDNWAAHKDATYAIHPWNETLLTYLNMKSRYPDDFYLVDYNRFFTAGHGDHSQISDLCNFLDLQPDDSMIDAYARAVEFNTSRVKIKKRDLGAESMQYLLDNANLDAYYAATGRTFSELESNRKAA